MGKKIILGVFSILICLVLVTNVFAITGSIGNARMILRSDTGETIDKYILVRNTNNVSIDIEIFASGDLEEDIDIKDDNFTLAPGEDKKAYFAIDVKEVGTFESKVNVMFAPEEGNGVGLSSTVIVIASGDDDDDDNDDNGGGSNDNGGSGGGGGVITNSGSSDDIDDDVGIVEEDINLDEGNVNPLTGRVTGEDNADEKDNKKLFMGLGMVTTIIFVLFLCLLVFKNLAMNAAANERNNKIKLKKGVKSSG